MRDFLPADVRKREHVIGVIKSVYERYAFEPLETPAVENIETLMGKYGEEGNQLIFKILKRGEHAKTGEADLALRYDLTVPLARVVAQYQNDLPKFFKRYQIQPVWRADRPARGRFREFYQCDVDVLGSKSMVVEAELIAAASDALVALGFKDFTIRLNHRRLLDGLLEEFEIPSQHRGQVLVSFDKLNKIGVNGVRQELLQAGLQDTDVDSLIKLFGTLEANFAESKGGSNWNWMALTGIAAGASQRVDAQPLISEEERTSDVMELRNPAMNRTILSRLLAWVSERKRNLALEEGIRELFTIISHLANTDARNYVKIDASLARGLSYYTGSIMEITVPDLAGSLGGGGRYDNLVGMFLGKDVPACGFSLGLERIIVVMSEREMFPKELLTSPADVMVTLWNEDSIGESIALASELRSAGLRVDLYPEADKMGKQFKYASSRGIPFVAIIGDDERARGEVAIKDLQSGEQLSVERDKVANAVRRT